MAGGAFAELMALSATQTQQSQSAVQQALLDRKRREEAKRNETELAERREKQREEKERKQYFEKQKQEAEAAKRRAEQEKIAEAARQRRADQARDTLLFGPKKAKSLHSSTPSGSSSPKWPSSSTGVKDDVKQKRAPAEHAGPEPLTREELRERKQQAENRRMLAAATAKRPAGVLGTRRAGKRLPGGAMDLMAAPSNNGNDISAAHKSVRERLAAMPNTLTKLNTVKRDVRTIDEIMQDRANAKAAKTLSGDQAKTFDDWFSTTKKKPQAPIPKRPSPTSEWSTPVVGRASPAIKPKPSTTSAPAKPANPSSSMKKPSVASGKQGTTASSSASASRNGGSKKRSRSPSYSDASPPKRRAVSYDDDEDDFDDAPAHDDVRSMIWGIMGKNRADYVSRDIISDDEDMEADANALEREEKASARLAKKEDEIEAERLRRREAEKAKKRMGGR